MSPYRGIFLHRLLGSVCLSPQWSGELPEDRMMLIHLPGPAPPLVPLARKPSGWSQASGMRELHKQRSRSRIGDKGGREGAPAAGAHRMCPRLPLLESSARALNLNRCGNKREKRKRCRRTDAAVFLSGARTGWLGFSAVIAVLPPPRGHGCHSGLQPPPRP